ncbi:MinD/ParA family protein [Candidatus Pacearchaeota archaeon]|nr:MinD/ParA family protein [Candidatus Pacearchaeota archaeon]
MGEVIGLIAIKGGVGKTTLASSLSADLANNQGKKVLLIDTNYSAPNLGIHMDLLEPEKTIHDVLAGRTRLESAVHSRFGVDVIAGRPGAGFEINPLKLRDKISRAKGLYDFIILDGSPSLNEEVLSTIIASNHLFVVTTPDMPTLSCSMQAAQLAKQRGKPVKGIVINKIRDPAYEISLKHIENSLDIPVVARIPDDKAQVRALFTRIPLPIYKKRSKFSREIHNLSAALSGKPETISFYKKFLTGFRKEEVNRQVLKEDFYTRTFRSRYE